MDNQQDLTHNNTNADFQMGNTDPMYSLERTEEYWNDLKVDALGPDTHDGMHSNIEGDIDHNHSEL